MPLYSALSVDAVSVEADIWLYSSSLHIGYERSDLTSAVTFDVLYIDTALGVNRRQIQNSNFLTDGRTDREGRLRHVLEPDALSLRRCQDGGRHDVSARDQVP